MSAFRIGAEAAGPPNRGLGVAGGGGDGGDGADGNGIKGILDRVTKWIPGEVITLYVAGITAWTAGQDEPEPSVGLLVAAAILAAAVTILVAFAASGTVPRQAIVSGLLATVAFLIWSLTVPFSGWQKLDFVAENPGKVAIIAAAAGLLFTLLGEGIQKATASTS